MKQKKRFCEVVKWAFCIKFKINEFVIKTGSDMEFNEL